MSQDYTKLRELLKSEQYPHKYIHKFIGQKTPEFMSGVATLEVRFPKAVKVSQRESAGVSSDIFIAMTYELEAASPDEIIELLEATSKITHLKVIL